MPFLIKLNNLSLNQNLPDAFDVESIDGFTNQSFIVNIARAQMRHLPYYTLAVVPSEGNNEFLDGVSKYYASKQAGGNPKKFTILFFPFSSLMQKIFVERLQKMPSLSNPLIFPFIQRNNKRL
ncbi:MAG: hypothetical protein HWD61_05720 [Parachlamydiaceae bacterium]|nr:MAG: hypothetical protein HWD61_05720 [Parachlamydiaceae bacterium]